MKGYKLYDLQTKQFFVSRETIFPFHSISPLDHLVDPSPNLVLPSLAPNLNSSGSFPSMSESSQLQVASENLPLCRSSRVTKPPSYLQDYHCSLLYAETSPSNPKVLYPLSNFLNYDKLSHSHKAFLLAISSQDEPRFYHQAILSPSGYET